MLVRLLVVEVRPLLLQVKMGNSQVRGREEKFCAEERAPERTQASKSRLQTQILRGLCVRDRIDMAAVIAEDDDKR